MPALSGSWKCFGRVSFVNALLGHVQQLWQQLPARILKFKSQMHQKNLRTAVMIVPPLQPAQKSTKNNYKLHIAFTFKASDCRPSDMKLRFHNISSTFRFILPNSTFLHPQSERSVISWQVQCDRSFERLSRFSHFFSFISPRSLIPMWTQAFRGLDGME